MTGRWIVGVGMAWLGAGALLLAGQAAGSPVTVDLRDAKGQNVGRATLTPVAGRGVLVALDLMNLSPGEHALHIHERASCEPPDFTSAGAHFNPHTRQHGLHNPAGPHAGDMPNIVVGADGTARASVTATGIHFGTGPGSVFGSGGTALVIHAAPDDMKTDPAGNAGARIACGVIAR